MIQIIRSSLKLRGTFVHLILVSSIFMQSVDGIFGSGTDLISLLISLPLFLFSHSFCWATVFK